MNNSASKDGPNLKGLAVLALILLAVGGIIAALWNSGKQEAEAEEAFAYPCRLATETPGSAQACVESMKASYEGPLDDPQRVSNAVAEHVSQQRGG